jgi:hypothetical protein
VVEGLELAILIGLQGSGKTTFCRRMLADTHVVVSKDAFRKARHRQRRQMRLVDEALAARRCVVADNTNPSPREWPLSGCPPRRVTVGTVPPDLPGRSPPRRGGDGCQTWGCMSAQRLRRIGSDSTGFRNSTASGFDRAMKPKRPPGVRGQQRTGYFTAARAGDAWTVIRVDGRGFSD